MQEKYTELQVTLSPGGKSFTAVPNTSLLESGLSAGIALPYRCANGSCGDCRATVLSGAVEKFRFHDYALNESEKINGVCLLCSNIAKTDLLIEVTEAESVDDIPLQQLRGKVCHIEYLPDVLILRLKITRGKALRFLPGQYATLTLPGGQSRLMPIANCPCESRYIEFHIPTVTANQSFPIENPGRSERITIDGPAGLFTLRKETPEAPVSNTLFIATGEYFAALKPLIELVISNDTEQPCELIWIATQQAGHYRDNLCRSWSDAFDWFCYTPLSGIADLTIQLSKQPPDRLALTDIYISAAENECQQLITMLKSSGAASASIVVDTTLGGKLNDFQPNI